MTPATFALLIWILFPFPPYFSLVAKQIKDEKM